MLGSLSFLLVNHGRCACWRWGGIAKHGTNTWELGTKQPVGGRGASACSAMLCRRVGGYAGNAGTAGAAVAWAGIPPARDLSGAFLLATVPLRLKALLFWALPMEKMKFMALAGVLHGNLSTPKGIVSLGTWLPAEGHKRSVTVCFGNRIYLMLQMFYQLTWLSKAMALVLKWIWTWSSGVSSRTVGARACLRIFPWLKHDSCYGKHVCLALFIICSKVWHVLVRYRALDKNSIFSPQFYQVMCCQTQYSFGRKGREMAQYWRQ